MLKSRLTTKLDKLRALRAALASGQGPVKETLDDWESLYRAFLVRRFDKFSLGGGNWRRLAASTERRKGHGKILVDSKFMRDHLAATIRVLARRRNSITVGFLSETIHPRAQLTVAELATIHNEGRGSVPKRQILVKPDDTLLKDMRAAARARYA